MFKTKNSGVADACRLAGSQRALAQVLDVSDTAVSVWVAQGYAPLQRAPEIEMTFGVPRAQLIDPRLLRVVAPYRLPLDLEL